MTTKKIVVSVRNDIQEFQQKINEHDGFATQFSTCSNGSDVWYTAIIFIKEEQ